MDDPHRLLDDPDASPLARELLASAAGDAPSRSQRAAAAKRLGLAAMLLTTGGEVGAGGVAGALWWKIGLLVVALGGAITGSVALLREPAPSAVMTRESAPAAARTAGGPAAPAVAPADEPARIEPATPIEPTPPAAAPAPAPAAPAAPPAPPAPPAPAPAPPAAAPAAAPTATPAPTAASSASAPRSQARASTPQPGATALPPSASRAVPALTAPGSPASPAMASADAAPHGEPGPAPATSPGEPGPAPAASPAEAGPTAAPGEPGPTAAPAPPAPAVDARRLAAEVAILDRARAALRRGDTAGAAAALDEHARDFTQGAHLAEEAELLRIEALVAAGDADQARRRARDFLVRFPQSPLARRLRSLIERLPAGPSARPPSPAKESP